MIILKDVPFERRARFLHDSICGYSESPELDAALSEQAVEIAGGLKTYHHLLRRIYSDVACIEGRSDKAKYMALVDTMKYLYAFFAFGTLGHDQEQHSVVIDKTLLQRAYKGGGFTSRKRHLEYHGLSIKYLAADGESASLSRASQLSMSYHHHPDLMPAVKFFADSIESLHGGKGKPMYNKLGIFLKGDYEAAILRKPIPRDALDPRRADLLDTVDACRDDWIGLVGALRGNCGLECSGFWTYGGTPSWGVSFFAKGKRPLAIFTLGPDIVFIEFTLPESSAETIIRERRRYSDSIRQRIESFHCVSNARRNAREAI